MKADKIDFLNTEGTAAEGQFSRGFSFLVLCMYFVLVYACIFLCMVELLAIVTCISKYLKMLTIPFYHIKCKEAQCTGKEPCHVGVKEPLTQAYC